MPTSFFPTRTLKPPTPHISTKDKLLILHGLAMDPLHNSTFPLHGVTTKDPEGEVVAEFSYGDPLLVEGDLTSGTSNKQEAVTDEVKSEEVRPLTSANQLPSHSLQTHSLRPREADLCPALTMWYDQHIKLEQPWSQYRLEYHDTQIQSAEVWRCPSES